MFTALTKAVVDDHKLGLRLAEEEESERLAKLQADRGTPSPPLFNPDSPRYAEYDTGSDGDEHSPYADHTHSSNGAPPAIAESRASFLYPHHVGGSEFAALASPIRVSSQSRRQSSRVSNRLRADSTGHNQRRRYKKDPLAVHAVARAHRPHYPYDMHSALHPVDHREEARKLHLHLRGLHGNDTEADAVARVEKALGLHKAIPPSLCSALRLAAAIVDDVAAEGDVVKGAEQLAEELGLSAVATEVDEYQASSPSPCSPSRLSPGSHPSDAPLPHFRDGLAAPVGDGGAGAGAGVGSGSGAGAGAGSGATGLHRPAARRPSGEGSTSAHAQSEDRRHPLDREADRWKHKKKKKKKKRKKKKRGWGFEDDGDEEVYDLLALSSGGGMTPNSEIIKQRRFWRPGVTGSYRNVIVSDPTSGLPPPRKVSHTGASDIAESTRDWNEEFQRLVDEIPLSDFQMEERTKKLHKLGAEFRAHCAAITQRLIQARVHGSVAKVEWVLTCGMACLMQRVSHWCP